MKNLVDATDSETVATVQARITKLKAEHKDVMARLYAYYDQSIEDDAKDHYLQTDDLRYFDDLPKGDEWAEHYTRLEVRKPITPVHRILKHGWDGTFRVFSTSTIVCIHGNSKTSSSKPGTIICRHSYHFTNDGWNCRNRRDRHVSGGQCSSHNQ